MGFTVVGNPAARVITSSSGFNALSPKLSDVSVDNAIKLAEEPEFAVRTKFTPRNFPISFSKSELYFPAVSQKSNDEATSVLISLVPYTLPDTGMNVFPGTNSFTL